MRKFIAICLIGSIICVSGVISAYSGKISKDQQHELVMQMTVPCEVATVSLPGRPATSESLLFNTPGESHGVVMEVETHCNSPGHRSAPV